MSLVCSWDDVAYGIYETFGRGVSDSEYGCDVYYNTLGIFLSNKIPCEESVLRVLGT